ncbi:MAG TPA: hypothetical protein VL100_01260, partial [Croceibacterium sp.]|nr:hypothetical protein [Croceibacterium sp.]
MKRALALVGAVMVVLGAVQAPAQDSPDLTVLPPPAKDYQPKKTEWGEPDFRGGWPIDSLNGRTPLERDEK